MPDINRPSAPLNGASPPKAAAPLGETAPSSLPHNPASPADDKPLPHPKSALFPWIEASLGGLVILLFIILIDIGYVMSSAACLGDLAKLPDGHWGQRAYLLLMFVLSYTASNVALLCCLSAFLGALGERTGIMGRVRTHDATYWRDGIRQYLAAILRGMFVFLVLMSGLMVLGAANFTTPTQAAYGNLAGAASLFSFLIGRDPRMFSKIVERVNRLEFEKDTPNDAADTHPGTANTILDKDKFTTEVKRTEEHVHAEATSSAAGHTEGETHGG